MISMSRKRCAWPPVWNVPANIHWPEAIVRGAEEKGIVLAQTSEFQSITGQGVSGTVDSHKVELGNFKFLESKGTNSAKLSQQADIQRAEGQTVMFHCHRWQCSRINWCGRSPQRKPHPQQ